MKIIIKRSLLKAIVIGGGIFLFSFFNLVLMGVFFFEESFIAGGILIFECICVVIYAKYEELEELENKEKKK